MTNLPHLIERCESGEDAGVGIREIPHEPGSVGFVEPGAKKSGDRISLPGGWYFERYNDDGVVFSLRTPSGRGFGIKGTGCGLYTETAQSFAKAMWQAAEVHAFECQECSGIGHTGIDGDEVYDCPACLGEGKLTPLRDAQWKLKALEAEYDHAKSLFDNHRAELDDISAAIGSPRFMDPPDGGYVPLAIQVRRMRAELEAKEQRLQALESRSAPLADATPKNGDHP